MAFMTDFSRRTLPQIARDRYVFCGLRVWRVLLRRAWIGVALGVPMFSHAEVVSPRRLLEVVDIGNPVISPDGRLVAFRTEQASVERNVYDTVWFIQSMDGS
jgi:hypothetical protein